MPKNLVIVESPAKAKTIEKYLGKDFKVASCFGHVADLPSNELGVDVERNFQPRYIVSDDKKKVVDELKELAKKTKTVWLASDEDREGEAIAWHLAKNLNLNEGNCKRIVFSEITKRAILEAIENPRSINYNLVNAQQARRVLDRLVGYELSPVLWKKVKTGLSAGRVQSVAVRLIVEREREIQAFTPVQSFKTQATFAAKQGLILAHLNKDLGDASAAKIFLDLNKTAKFSVSEVQKKPGIKTPSAPFTTSTLQQEASRKLYFSVSKTMTLAQRLYEAGLITYMRTDSVNLSVEAQSGLIREIKSLYGEIYAKERNYKTKNKGAQEAHEAIRPTDPACPKIQGDRDQERLYELIWKRSIASQMSDAKLERTQIHIVADVHDDKFVAKGEVIKFDGFLKVYMEGVDDDEEKIEGLLPKVAVGESLELKSMSSTQRFSRPPYRFSEASLVRQLEDLGIGRPSTYAPTISTVQNRGYIRKGTSDGTERKYLQLNLKDKNIEEMALTEKVGVNKGKLVPSDVGMVVNDFLIANFDSILDYNFTAKLEESFDDIARGAEEWTNMLKGFYKPFRKTVEFVKENAVRESGERLLGIDPKTNRPLKVRLGKFGPIAQIGDADDEKKPVFASLFSSQQLETITFEEALKLFELPKSLGNYEGGEVIVNSGRYGPYLKYNSSFISLPKKLSPMEVGLDEAIVLIEQKKKADAPICTYNNLPVTKGVGRFGPFIKWDGMFINVNKKYDFDNLSEEDIVELIEVKVQKEKEKIIHNWDDAGIRVEKARWGRSAIIRGKQKVEISKDIDATKLTLAEAKALLDAQKPSKRKTKKKK